MVDGRLSDFTKRTRQIWNLPHCWVRRAQGVGQIYKTKSPFAKRNPVTAWVVTPGDENTSR